MRHARCSPRRWRGRDLEDLIPTSRCSCPRAGDRRDQVLRGDVTLRLVDERRSLKVLDACRRRCPGYARPTATTRTAEACRSSAELSQPLGARRRADGKVVSLSSRCRAVPGPEADWQSLRLSGAALIQARFWALHLVGPACQVPEQAPIR